MFIGLFLAENICLCACVSECVHNFVFIHIAIYEVKFGVHFRYDVNIAVVAITLCCHKVCGVCCVSKLQTETHCVIFVVDRQMVVNKMQNIGESAEWIA